MHDEHTRLPITFPLSPAERLSSEADTRRENGALARMIEDIKATDDLARKATDDLARLESDLKAKLRVLESVARDLGDLTYRMRKLREAMAGGGDYS